MAVVLIEFRFNRPALCQIFALLFEDFRMDEVKRTPLIVMLAGLVGFMFGSTIPGCAVSYIGVSLLRFATGGIHSNWMAVVLIVTLVCTVLGGVAGAKGAIRLVKSWHL
jgi:hypothetical protein